MKEYLNYVLKIGLANYQIPLILLIELVVIWLRYTLRGHKLGILHNVQVDITVSIELFSSGISSPVKPMKSTGNNAARAFSIAYCLSLSDGSRPNSFSSLNTEACILKFPKPNAHW